MLGVNSVEEINFSSPFSNSFSLGTPFLVEYDNTTSLKAIKNADRRVLILHSKVMGLLTGLEIQRIMEQEFTLPIRLTKRLSKGVIE